MSLARSDDIRHKRFRRRALTLRGAADHLRGYASRAVDLVRLVMAGNAAKAWWAVTYRMYSDSTSLGMRRDLAVPFTGPSAKIPITVRRLAADDDLSALDPAPGLSADERLWRMAQLRLLRSGIGICYVGVAPDGQPCYMQWVMPSSENARLKAFFGNLYPRLGPEEALLEGAYTPDAYRGKGIMGAAMTQVAERAADVGARWVITFVDEQNQGSVKGCIRAGFVPYLRRRERFRLFYRRVTFDLIQPAAASTPPV